MKNFSPKSDRSKSASETRYRCFKTNHCFKMTVQHTMRRVRREHLPFAIERYVSKIRASGT